jgi:hypothetical protein
MSANRATRTLLARLVEQPEPTVGGEWYVVSLDALAAAGYTAVGIHFWDDQLMPHDVKLYRKETPDA